VMPLDSDSGGTIVFSTRLEREGENAEGTLRLRGDEGVVLRMRPGAATQPGVKGRYTR
jgi:hypothetical protein